MADLLEFPRRRGAGERRAGHRLSPEFTARLRELHARQARRLAPAERYAFPDLDDPRYYVVFADLAPDGAVRGALLFHATTEVFVIGDDPGLLRSIWRSRRQIAAALRAAGADELHAFVPNSMKQRMGRWLERFGFRPSNRCFTPFYVEVPDGERR